jgi:hypothetical protein
MLAFAGAVKRLKRLCAPPARTGARVAVTDIDGGVHRSVNLEPHSPNERPTSHASTIG